MIHVRDKCTTLLRVTIAAAAVMLAGLWMAGATPVASGRGQAGVQEASPAERSGFVIGIRKRLTACHERLARVGEPLAETIRGMKPADIDAESLASKVEAAKAAFKSATLAREGFEMELKGYLDATFPSEQSTFEKELEQANDDLSRAKKKQAVADERFETIKKLFEKSASGIDLEYRFEVGRFIAELEEKKAGFSIEQAKSKLKVLRNYEKDKRTRSSRRRLKGPGRTSWRRKPKYLWQKRRSGDRAGPARSFRSQRRGCWVCSIKRSLSTRRFEASSSSYARMEKPTRGFRRKSRN